MSKTHPQTINEMQEMATELPFSASILIRQFDQSGKLVKDEGKKIKKHFEGLPFAFHLR